MDEEHHHTAMIYEIKGFLTEFKDNTMQKFTEVKEVVAEVNQNALIAQQKAEEAQKAAMNALGYSEMVVYKSGIVGGSISLCMLGLVWIVENGAKILSIVR